MRLQPLIKYVCHKGVRSCTERNGQVKIPDTPVALVLLIMAESDINIA